MKKSLVSLFLCCLSLIIFGQGRMNGKNVSRDVLSVEARRAGLRSFLKAAKIERKVDTTNFVSNAVDTVGTIIRDGFWSQSLNAWRNVDVYVPYVVSQNASSVNVSNSQRKFPVIFVLHGAGIGHSTYSTVAEPTLDRLIASGAIDSMIVVFPDGSSPAQLPDDSPSPYNGSFYTNSELNGAFEDYIVKDLILFIDSKYNTTASRNKRAIWGHSMGAYGAMKLALKHPNLFRAVTSHSGPLDFNQFPTLIPSVWQENGGNPPFQFTPDPNKSFTLLAFTMAAAFSPNLACPPSFVDFPLDSDGNLVEATFAKWLEHAPLRYAQHCASLGNLAVYFDCGRQDDYKLLPFNQAFADSLDRLGVNHTFEEFEGDHFLKLVDLSFLGIKNLAEGERSRAEISLGFIDSVFNACTVTVVSNEVSKRSTTSDRNLSFNQMRAFRDNVLRQYKEGNDYIGMYYKFGDFLKCDPASLLQSATVLPHLFKAMHALQANDENIVIVTPELHRAMMAIIENYRDVEDRELQNILARIGKDLNAYQGLTKNKLLARMTPVKGNESKTSATEKMGEIVLLEPNKPNPFNPSTTIKYALPQEVEVKLLIFDMLGRRVRTLVDQRQPAGRYAITWDGRNEQGEAIASGVYIYQLRVGSFVQTRRMALVR